MDILVSELESDTYYFEKYSNGKLDRKHINSQGEVAEDVGVGFVNEDDDLMDKVWGLTDEYLQNNFTTNMLDLKFKGHEVK